jgi:hypothetical protein
MVKGGYWRTVPAPFPLELAFREIEKALEIGLFYLAIVVTLSIPDICARLELPPEIEVRQKHYAAWMQNYFLRVYGGPNSFYAGLNGVDFYRLRCGLVHESSLKHRRTKFTHIFFHVRKPNERQKGHLQSRLWAHGDSQTFGVELDTVMFCNHMIEIARLWYRGKQQDNNVRLNLPNLVRFRPDGYPPFCDLPIIA